MRECSRVGSGTKSRSREVRDPQSFLTCQGEVHCIPSKVKLGAEALNV